MKNHSPLSIILYAVLACFIWSTAFIGIKIGFHYAKPFSFAGIRFILAGIILIPFCDGFSSFHKTIIARGKTVLLVGIFQTFLVYGLFYTAMTIVPQVPWICVKISVRYKREDMVWPWSVTKVYKKNNKSLQQINC